MEHFQAAFLMRAWCPWLATYSNVLSMQSWYTAIFVSVINTKGGKTLTTRRPEKTA